MPGLLTIGGRAGALSQAVSIGGNLVKIEPVAGAILAELKLTVAGSGEIKEAALIALGRCTGVVWRPWAGGAIGPALASDAGIPSAADARAAVIQLHDLHGGGLATRSAKLFELGLQNLVQNPGAKLGVGEVRFVYYV